MPRFLTIEQGSEIWLSERAKRVTATDMSAIMGISLWKCAHDVYLDKVGLAPPFVTNPAIEFGRLAEGPLRLQYERDVQEWFPPAVVVSDDDIFLASLDGLNSAHTKMLEIKTCNEEVFKKALLGEVPDYYNTQVQMGMHCIPTVFCTDVLFYNRKRDESTVVTVPRDPAYIEKITAIGREFHKEHIEGGVPVPEPEDTHIQVIVDDEALVNEYVELNKHLPGDLKRDKELRAAMADMGDSGDVELCSKSGTPMVRLTRVCKTGNVDWPALCKAHGIQETEIDTYRKPQIGYYKYTIAKR